MKTLIAAALSATLALTSVPASAQNMDRDDQIAAILFGLATLAIIGKVIEDRKDDDRDRDRRNAGGQRQGRDGIGIPPGQRVLPAACFTRVETRNGPVRMFGRRCLQNNYRFADRLPQRCAIRVEGLRHDRHGYRPHCLRDAGFTMARR